MPDSPPHVSGLIDGRGVTVPKGTTILEAARSIGAGIPTLCHHEGLEPEGACRLCLVELESGELAASCLYPLRADGFKIETRSPAVLEARALVVALMLIRAPDSKIVRDLAKALGVEPDPRLARVPADGCLRCGRCARACALAGSEAVSLSGRGADRRAGGPFGRPPADCLGCLSCARVCPTGIIEWTGTAGRRSVWGRDFELVPCPSCGRPHATAGELQRPGADPLCPACRRRAMAASLAAVPTPRP